MPSLMFWVLAKAWAMKRSGAGRFSQGMVKCSPIQPSW